MENLIQLIERANAAVNNVVWGIPMLVLLLATGVYLTVGTRFFQVRRFGYVIKNTLGSLFRNKSTRKSDEHGAISQFQALATALAATVGTGNIVGVVTAIAAGGPGAVFWMWVSAFFGMMTKYAEIVLGMYFRHKDEKGEWVGGPMYYIEKGLHQKWLAVAFAIFCLFASFGIGSIAQVNGIAGAMTNSFHIPNYITGIVVCVLTAVIVFGGMKRMVAVTEKFVPFMAILYIGGALIVILANADNLGPAFRSIFEGAFQLRAVGGGAAGYNLSIPPERAMLEKRQIECQIEVLLAGRAAELLVGGDDAVTAGAANDLSRAAELAAALVMDLGMAGEPAVSLRALSRACGGGDEAKALCRQKLGELFANVSDLLLEHADELLLLTDALVEREAMSGEEVEALLRAA